MNIDAKAIDLEEVRRARSAIEAAVLDGLEKYERAHPGATMAWYRDLAFRLTGNRNAVLRFLP